MPLKMIKSDLPSVSAEAIVYAETKLPFSIFNFNSLQYDKKGREILASREAIQPLAVGEVKLDETKRLSSQYILHTSAPIWHGGLYQEERLLRGCYEKIFRLVIERNFSSIALPIIASDHLGYSKKMTQNMAFSCIQKFLAEHPNVTVFLILPNLASVILPGNRYSEIRTYLNKSETEAKKKASQHNAPTSISENDSDTPSRQDRLLQFCQSKNIEDPYEINQILFRFGEEQLEL